MKTAKKALALLLAVLMCASLFTTMAFADNEHEVFPSREPTHVKILSIGTNIDTDVYKKDDGTFAVNGIKKYPYLAAERLQKIVGSSIAVSLQTLDQGEDTYMTASLLRSILTEGAYYDESSQYNQDAYNAYLTGFEEDKETGKILTKPEQMKAAYNRYVDGIKGKGITVSFNSNATTMTLVVDTNPPTSIKDMYSSIITVDLINASLTPYLMERLTAMMGNVNEDGIFLGDTGKFRGDLPAKVHEQAVTGSGDMIQLLLENLYTEAFIGVPEQYQPIVRAVCNAVSYTVFSFYADFKQDLEYIKWANPLAKLVIVGGYNDLEGLKIKLDDTYTIDFGSFWGAVINIVNSAITNDKNSAAYQFADLSTNRYVESRFGSIMNAAQEAKTLEKQYSSEGGPKVFLPTDVNEVDEPLAKDIKEMVYKLAPKIIYDQVMASFEQNLADVQKIKPEMTLDGLIAMQMAAADFEGTQDEYIESLVEAMLLDPDTKAMIETMANNTLQAFADAGKVTKLEVTKLAGVDFEKLLDKCMFYDPDDTYPALLTDAEASLLDIFARFFVGGKLDIEALMASNGDVMSVLKPDDKGNGLQPGIGLQPSDDSQDEIGEAVFQAIWEWENASMKGEDATLTIFDNIFGGILNTFRTPILKTINTVFSNMLHGAVDWFSNFFSNLFNR